MTKTFSAWALKYAYRNGGTQTSEIYVPSPLGKGGEMDGNEIALFKTRSEARRAAMGSARPMHVLVQITEVPCR